MATASDYSPRVRSPQTKKPASACWRDRSCVGLNVAMRVNVPRRWDETTWSCVQRTGLVLVVQLFGALVPTDVPTGASPEIKLGPELEPRYGIEP
jgi:hypothetical protein